MNLKEVRALSNKELRIMVARLDKYRKLRREGGYLVGYKDGQTFWREVPNYPQDLNAMHEAEKLLNPEHKGEYSTKFDEYCTNLALICVFNNCLLRATARQRAEAFVLTMEN